MKCPVKYPVGGGGRRKEGGEEEDEGRKRRRRKEEKEERGRRRRRKEEGQKQISSLAPLHSDTPHTFTLTYSNPHTHTHLIRRLFMFWGGEVHGDRALYVRVSRLLPLALTCDHMIVVHFTLRVSGCAPVPGKV